MARQDCGAFGKRANCQSLVSLTLARGEVPVPVGLCLFLPEEWTNAPVLYAQAVAASPRSKGEIALSALDHLRAKGVSFGVVLANAGYGISAAFRLGLDARGLVWALGIAKDQKLYNQKVYDPGVRLVPPPVWAHKPAPDQVPREAEVVLAACLWRRVTSMPSVAAGHEGRPLGLLRHDPHASGRRPGLGQQFATCRARRSGGSASGASQSLF